MRPPLRPPDDPPDADAPAATVSGPAAAPDTLLDILDPIPEVDPVDNPFGLSPRELLFVEAYLGAAQFRAAKAYELAGYKTTGAASRANASRMLTRERVAAAIEATLGQRVKALRIMDGDEALEGISTLARSDIRKIFPPTHWIAQLPDDIATCIKSVTPTKHGHRIELYDKGHHLEVMAKVSGRLKETLKVEHSLEDILALSNRLESGADA
jgi:hypothetical protein